MHSRKKSDQGPVSITILEENKERNNTMGSDNHSPRLGSFPLTKVFLILGAVAVFGVFASNSRSGSNSSISYAPIREGQTHQTVHHGMITKYDDANWKDLPLNAQKAAVRLGYSQKSWNLNEDPKNFDKSWVDLNSKELEAATTLGYTSRTWDYGPATSAPTSTETAAETSDETDNSQKDSSEEDSSLEDDPATSAPTSAETSAESSDETDNSQEDSSEEASSEEASSEEASSEEEEE